MTNVDFRWDIRNGETTNDGVRLDPGTFVEGTVTITPQGELNCRGVSLRLEWHTEGRGDRDRGVVAQQQLVQNPLPTGQPAVFPFRMELPAQPWSYHGFYINILWELIAEIDLPLAINPKSSSLILLRPRAA
jgi:hypothetical protein